MMKNIVCNGILWFIFPLLFIFPQLGWSKGSAIIVFDTSGSMWGKIDEINKITIARDVMGTLVKDWNKDIESR